MPVVADSLSPYGPLHAERARIGARLRNERRRAKPHLISFSTQLTRLDVAFLIEGAQSQGISRAEFVRRIISVERLDWQRNGLWKPAQGQ